MILGSEHKINDQIYLNLKIDNNLMKRTRIQKLLGVHIDDKLYWSVHIDDKLYWSVHIDDKLYWSVHIDDKLYWSIHIGHLCTAISSKTSLLRQLSKYVSNEVLKKFYQGYILPIWGLFLRSKS